MMPRSTDRALAERAPCTHEGGQHGLGFAGALAEVGLPAGAIPLVAFWVYEGAWTIFS